MWKVKRCGDDIRLVSQFVSTFDEINTTHVSSTWVYPNFLYILTKTGTVFKVWIQWLRTPNEAFFHWNPVLLGLGRQIGQINFRAFGIFSAELSVPILVLWAPCPCFPIINHYFSLYIYIPNIHLGLGFEFWSQRIRDLGIVCP